MQQLLYVCCFTLVSFRTGPLWLGAYRTLGSTPTTMWTDCSLAQLTPWQNATYSADKLCAEVHGDTFAWQKCNVLHQFICEGHIGKLGTDQNTTRRTRESQCLILCVPYWGGIVVSGQCRKTSLSFFVCVPHQDAIVVPG